MADASNALSDFLHAVFVNVWVVVKLSEILRDSSPLTLFFRYIKKGRVVERIGTILTIRQAIIKRVSWFKSSLLLRIQSDSFTNINS